MSRDVDRDVVVLDHHLKDLRFVIDDLVTPEEELELVERNLNRILPPKAGAFDIKAALMEDQHLGLSVLQLREGHRDGASVISKYQFPSASGSLRS